MSTQSTDPYVKYRTEWQMQNDNISASKQNWQRIAFLLTLVCLGQQVLIYHGQNKSHVVPYVVNVDDLGRAKVITEIKEAPINDERVNGGFFDFRDNLGPAQIVNIDNIWHNMRLVLSVI